MTAPTRAPLVSVLGPLTVTSAAFLVQWTLPPYGQVATYLSLAILLGWCYVLLRRAKRIYREALADLDRARATATALRDALPPPAWIVVPTPGPPS